MMTNTEISSRLQVRLFSIARMPGTSCYSLYNSLDKTDIHAVCQALLHTDYARRNENYTCIVHIEIAHAATTQLFIINNLPLLASLFAIPSLLRPKRSSASLSRAL